MKAKLPVAVAAFTLTLSSAALAGPHPHQDEVDYLLAPDLRVVGYEVFHKKDTTGDGKGLKKDIKHTPDLLRTIPARNADGSVNVLVEIPAGDLRKFETDHDTGRLFWEIKNGVPRVVQYLPYPGNYGSIPGTRSGDGDPLDVITIGPAHKRGEIVPAKVIGVLKMIDDGDEDSKLIAVIPGTDVFNVDDMDELDAQFPGISDIIAIWLTSYKGPDGGIECEPEGCYGDAAEANSRLNDAIANFEANGL